MAWAWRAEPTAGQSPCVILPAGNATRAAANAASNGSQAKPGACVPVLTLPTAGAAKEPLQILPTVTLRSATPTPRAVQTSVVVLPGQRQQSPPGSGSGIVTGTVTVNGVNGVNGAGSGSGKGNTTPPVSVPVAPLVQVSVPVESVSMSKAGTPRLVASQASADKALVEKNLLSRIDGVVSEMERELSEDMLLCGGSPLVGPRAHCKGALAGAGVGVGVGVGAGVGESGGENTIDWIDKQIWAIENRKEACEMRQAHLADLRRMVSEGQPWGHSHSHSHLHYADKALPLALMGSEDSGAGSSTVLGCSDEELPGATRPALAALEAEHELLKRQVQAERDDLQRVRQLLESECEGRMQEARSLAEAAETGRRRAWAAEETSERRAREAASEASSLQEQLRRAEEACEQKHRGWLDAAQAQQQAGEDLHLLEENSRAVLEDCRALQGKVRELQAERATLLAAQAGFEEQRRMLQTRIRLLEEQRSEAEVQRQALVDEHYTLSREHNGLILSRDQQSLHEESALMRREALFREELAQRDATLAAAKASWCQAEETRSRQSNAQISELENELARLQQQVADALAAEAGAERRARTWSAEAEQRHLALVAEAEGLRSDLADSKTVVLRERSVREELERRHAQAEAEVDQARTEHRSFRETWAGEKQAQAEGQARQRDVEMDLRRDLQQLQADHAAEQRSRQQVEQRHSEVTADLERLRVEHERLQQCKAEAERKHQEVERDNSRLQGDMERLQQDLGRESATREEYEQRHRAVEEEKSHMHGDRRKLEELVQQEQQARLELEQQHRVVDADRKQVLVDRDELQRAKDEERQRYLAAAQEAERLDSEVQRLQKDLEAEQRGRRELEQQRERGDADLERLKRDLEAELRNRKDQEQRRERVEAELERSIAEQQQLRAELALERRGREEAQKQHQGTSQDLERLQSEGRAHQQRATRIALELETQQQLREDLERRHREERERLRSGAEEARGADRQAFEELQRLCEDFKVEKQRLLEELEAVRRRSETDAAGRETEAASREDAERRLRLLQEEFDDLSARVVQLRKVEADFGLLEGSLRQVRQELEEERRRSGDLEHQLGQLRNLEIDLEEARNATLRLRADLDQARLAEENLKRDAEEAMEKSSEAKRKMEMVWKAKLEQAKKEIETLRAGDRLDRPGAAWAAGRKSIAAGFDSGRPSADRLSLTERLSVPTVPQDQQSHSEQMSVGSERPSLSEQQQLPPETLRALQAQSQRASYADRPSVSERRPSHSERSSLPERASLTDRPSLTSERPSVRAGAETGKTLDDLRRKHSLWVEPMVGRASLSGLLDSQADGFKRRLQDAQNSTRETLRGASQLHVDLVSAEFEAAKASRSSGQDPRRALQDLQRAPELSSRREKVQEQVEGALTSARGLLDELQRQGGARPEEQRQAAELLEGEISRCEEELVLLRRQAALSDVPNSLLRPLVDLHSGQDASSVTWQGNFTPMHWCALHGRRDIIEYMRQQPWGREMVDARDVDGRTPCFYAEHARSRGTGSGGLILYLREEAGATATPCQPLTDRPSDLSMLDRYKREILSTVEAEGWHAVKWKDGKSMLHWAAEKGHGELCRYLVAIGADLEAKDSHGRTPADCAGQSGHLEVAQLLRECRENPREWVHLSAFPEDTPS